MRVADNQRLQEVPQENPVRLCDRNYNYGIELVPERATGIHLNETKFCVDYLRL